MKKKSWFTIAHAKLVVGIILFIVVFGGILYTVLNGFDVKEIEFEATGMEIEFNERLIAGNVIFFPSEKVRQTILYDYPQLKDVQIRKKFPHTILIKPILREPYTLLTTSKAIYFLDEEGVVISLGTPNGMYPELLIDVPVVRIGKLIDDPNVQSALQFLEQSKPFLIVSLIQSIDNGSSLKATSDKTEILFTHNQQMETVIATLQTIITGVRIKGTMPKGIDVRFSKPVIQW